MAKRLGLCLAVTLFVLACGTSTSTGPAASGAPKPRAGGTQLLVAHTPISDPSNEFRKLWYDQIQNTVTGAGAKYLFCSANNDAITQANCLDQFLAQKADAVVIWPVDYAAATSSIKKLNQAGVPVFQYLSEFPADSGVKLAATVGFDELQQGINAGQGIVAALQQKNGSAKGTILEVEGLMTQGSAQLRSAGFHQVVDKNPDIKVVSKDAAWDGSKATTIVQDWFTVNPSTDAIYMHSDCDYLPAVQAALKPLGRYVPSGNPKHVILAGEDGCNSTINAIACSYVEMTSDSGLTTFNPLLASAITRYLQTGKLPQAGETMTAAGGRTAQVALDPKYAGPQIVLKPLVVTKANASSPDLQGNSFQGPPNGTSGCK